MNVIFATGALRKFMEARARGASRQVLTQLSAAAMAEQPAVASPTPFQGLIARMQDKPRVIIDLERARLERSWESAPGD